MKNLIVYLTPLKMAHEIMKYSEQVASRLNLSIHFIYNVENEVDNINQDSSDLSTDEIVEKVIEDKKFEIQQLIENHEWTDGNIVKVHSVYSGSIKKMFKTLALVNHCELILFPFHDDDTKSQEKLVYSILDIMNIPVWCFSANAEFRQVKTIVYGSDYNKEDIDVLKSLTQLAQHFGAKINILHVYKSEKFKQQLIDTGLKELVDKKIEYPDIEIHSKKKSSVVSGISDFSKTTFADLVVLLKKNKFFFQDLLRKGTVEKLFSKIDLPLLIYKK